MDAVAESCITEEDPVFVSDADATNAGAAGEPVCELDDDAISAELNANVGDIDWLAKRLCDGVGGADRVGESLTVSDAAWVELGERLCEDDAVRERDTEALPVGVGVIAEVPL